MTDGEILCSDFMFYARGEGNIFIAIFFYMGSEKQFTKAETPGWTVWFNDDD